MTLEEVAIPSELRAPLPFALRAAQRRGLADYQAVEELQDLKVYASQHRSPTAPEPEPEPSAAPE